MDPPLTSDRERVSPQVSLALRTGKNEQPNRGVENMGTGEPGARTVAPTTNNASILGSRARWGRVGYNGSAFAPAPGTYAGVAGERAQLTTVHDSGRARSVKAPIANLYPLIAAVLYEVAFANEAGPLDTWRN